MAKERTRGTGKDDGSDGEDRQQKRKKRKKADEKPDGILEWAKSIAIAVVLFIFIRTFLLQTFVITSGSMMDTLLVGDMLVADRASIGARIPGTEKHIPGYSGPRRGDVWVFDPHHEVDMKLVKRLMGLPGDTLEMRDGTLLVNGVELDEPYVNETTHPDDRSPQFAWQRDHLLPGADPATYAPTRRTWGPIVVPEGHFFMLGDNRDESLDSRYWGPLASWRLEGRVAFTYFSYDAESHVPFPALREIRWSRVLRLVH